VVRISFELSSALTHVHRNDIVYRDLKPANVGFDFHGRVRLFDFGLAKELSRSASFHLNAVYNLTKMSGTPRFMACEVANGLPYNEKCDVYSFSLLCWQMATLKKPYEGYTIGKLEREAWQPPCLRPKIHSKWPLWFRKLLSIGWSADIRERPSMHDVESLLAEQVSHFDGNFDLANHLSPHRRSTLAVAEERFHRENGLSCR
jgi:serine/threonine protein kinase